MSLVTINDVPVLSGSIAMPLIGVWTADVVIDQPDGTGFDAGTRVTISSADGAELVGTVAAGRSGSFLDSVHVRVLGGAGGMSRTAQPRSYASPSAYVRDVLNGLASDSGETLSADIPSSVSAAPLNAWSVMAVPVSQALVTLINAVSEGSSWRLLPDGTLWIGTESWPTASPAVDILSQNPVDGTYDLGVNTVSVIPGVTLENVGQVARVEHQILPEKIRSRVWTTMASERGLVAAIQAIVAQQVAALDYHALYLAQVKGQSSDLTTVDIQPVTSRLGGLQRVPVRFGAGVTQQVPINSTVLLGWDGGDPTQPYVLGLLSSGMSTKTVIAATQVYLSAESGAENVVTQTDITNIFTAISGAPVTPMDGGASFKAGIIASWPVAVGSNAVKAAR